MQPLDTLIQWMVSLVIVLALGTLLGLLGGFAVAMAHVAFTTILEWLE